MRFRNRKIDEGHMTESNQQSEQAAPPEDVATLYSWANLHGAKYRDFSAARAQTRERARQRVEHAMGEELRRNEPETAAQEAEGEREIAVQAAEGERAAEDAHAAEQTQQSQGRQDQVELEHSQQE